MTDPLAEFREARGPRLPSDVERICALPIVPAITDAEAEALSLRYVQARAYNGKCGCTTCKGKPFRLLEDQAKGFKTWLDWGCGLFSIKVGGGKTALGMLIASDFYTSHPFDRVLVIVPSTVYRQLMVRDLPWAREHFAVTSPYFGLGKMTGQKRKTLASCGLPGTYVITYSLLSTRDTSELLEAIQPSLIIADEAHLLKDGTSAKIGRFWAYVDRKKPKGVLMSGTLTNRTPMEYHRLARWVLGPYCPLPRPTLQANAWSNVIRSGAEPLESERESMAPLLRWAKEHDPQVENERDAYRLRLHTCPGFVSSGDKALGVALVIANQPAQKPGPRLLELIRLVEEEWTGPNGEVLTHAIEKHAFLQQLHTGFYFKRYWDESHPKVEQAKWAFDAQQEYHRELRRFFTSVRYPRPGLDTPMLVGRHHADEGPIGGWDDLYDLWKVWHELADDPDLPDRESEPVWVDDFKVDLACKWALNQPGGIVWVYHRPVLDRVAFLLATLGKRVMRKPAGEDWARDDGSDHYICVASISAHHKGRNLQHHQHQLILEWPRSAQVAEQLIGRTHRIGQEADCLTVMTCLTLDYEYECQAATLADTVYDAETMGGQRKLLIAGWDPLPREYPPEFLRARGWTSYD